VNNKYLAIVGDYAFTQKFEGKSLKSHNKKHLYFNSFAFNRRARRCQKMWIKIDLLLPDILFFFQNSIN